MDMGNALGRLGGDDGEALQRAALAGPLPQLPQPGEGEGAIVVETESLVALELIVAIGWGAIYQD